VIYRIFANQATFKEIAFRPDFNLILADRTDESTARDSRNGLGKSTLIGIIHFLLGAQRSEPFTSKDLEGWEFGMELDVGHERLIVRRATDWSHVEVDGEFSEWPIPTELKQGRTVVRINDWNRFLGLRMFNLDPELANENYSPRFRSLLSYFVRRGPDAFTTPFEHYRKQQVWDWQVNNLFLLDLPWPDARDWQILRDRKSALAALKKAAESGAVPELQTSQGELEAQRVRLASEIARRDEELRTFRVHDQYREVEREADDLTQRIQSLLNANVRDRRLLSSYESSIDEVPAEDTEEISSFYEEAGVVLGSAVVRRLEEVERFHRQLIRNRRSFLETEVMRLRGTINDREESIRTLTDARATAMDVLDSHGALDDFNNLEERNSQSKQRLAEVESSIRRLKEIEQGSSALKVDQETLYQRARRNLDERDAARDKALYLFNENSEALYEAPGNLVIDIGPSGYKLDVEIERSGSHGIGRMKIFSYDMVLAEIWADSDRGPDFLVHDSVLFDGVDSRQVALALERAMHLSEVKGFQYICTLNSDDLPLDDFSEGLDLDPFVVRRLTDLNPEGRLLGIAFDQKRA
jgi:uncharacterized protein YydD (DUF2326 family)